MFDGCFAVVLEYPAVGVSLAGFFIFIIIFNILLLGLMTVCQNWVLIGQYHLLNYDLQFFEYVDIGGQKQNQLLAQQTILQ